MTCGRLLSVLADRDLSVGVTGELTIGMRYDLHDYQKGSYGAFVADSGCWMLAGAKPTSLHKDSWCEAKDHVCLVEGGWISVAWVEG
jgi:hypothetical protein